MLNIYYARSDSIVNNLQLDNSYKLEIRHFMNRLAVDDSSLIDNLQLFYHDGRAYNKSIFEQAQIIFVGIPNTDNYGNRLIGKGLYNQIKSAYERDIPVYYLTRIDDNSYIDEIDFNEDIHSINESDWKNYARISVYPNTYLVMNPDMSSCDSKYRKAILKRIGYTHISTPVIDSVTFEEIPMGEPGLCTLTKVDYVSIPNACAGKFAQEGRRTAIFTLNNNDLELLLLLR